MTYYLNEKLVTGCGNTSRITIYIELQRRETMRKEGLLVSPKGCAYHYISVYDSSALLKKISTMHSLYTHQLLQVE